MQKSFFKYQYIFLLVDQYRNTCFLNIIRASWVTAGWTEIYLQPSQSHCCSKRMWHLTATKKHNIFMQALIYWITGNQFTSKVVHSTGLLIFCDVAISHNWPQIATFRIIHQKSHNSDKIAKFEEIKGKYSLLTQVLRQFKRRLR